MRGSTFPPRRPASSGNHTRGFTDAAATLEAHEATIRAATELTALHIYEDGEFREAVHTSFGNRERGGD
jgi:hypothetical protein